jgi:D-alanine--poly(phosphoribitol) ligase subunit 1
MRTNFNLAQAVWQHSLSAPQSIAIAYNGQTLSYEDFAAHAKALAQQLSRAHHGRTPVDQPLRVGILSSRGLHACVAIMGTCWAGATYVPLGLKLPEDKLLAILSACQLSALIVDAEGANRLTTAVLAACPEWIIRLDQQLESKSVNQSLCDVSQPVQVNAHDLAYVIFTSGTTGIPKGVMIEAGAVNNYLQTIVSKLDLQATDRALETCDISFDFSVHNMFATWQAGAALYILPATLVMNAVKFARAERLTVWNSVPSLVGMLQQLKVLQPACLPDLRVTVLGGEALPTSTAHLWQEVAPHTEIFNLYGPTEATVFCLAQVFSRQAATTQGRDFVSIGTALDGCEAMVVDAAGKEVSDGQPGELAIAGTQLARGYMGQSELTAQKFPVLNGKRWYLTGDNAVKEPTGVFHCLGRIDNQVKVSGYRIELEEIDAALRLVSGRDLVAAVAWPVVDGMAKGIVGFIAGASMDTSELLVGLKQKLQAYMVPHRVIFLDVVPLNTSGKVDRKALAEKLQEASAGTA